MRALLAVILLGGCGPKEPGTVPDGDDTDVTDDNDELLAAAEALYDPDRVLQIEFEIDDADAEALSLETNSIFALLDGENCMDAPPKGPFNWYSANAIIDGVRYDNVGARKKGLIGSLSTSKPGLKIKFDKFVDGQTMDGIERLTLNNSVSDPSLVRQCLGYQLFRDAGIAAPRCNFAHVTANGEDLGVYVNVEPVKKTFLKWAYDGDDDGDLYEGTLSDMRDGWTQTFEPKTSDSDPALGPIHDATTALSIDNDDDMLAALDDELDLNNFYDFWAMEVLVGHVDGYTGNTNNFFVYQPETTGKLEFLPWGIDATFQRFEAFGSDSNLAVFANSALSRRLWEIPETRDLYLDALDGLLDTVWNESELIAEVDRMAALVEPFAIDDPAQRQYAQDDLLDFISTRTGEIEDLMALPAVEFTESLRGDICLIEAGTLRIDFDTSWGTLEVYDPLNEGAGQIVGSIDGVPFDFTGGAIAGEDAGNASFAAVVLTGPTTANFGLVSMPEYDVELGTQGLDGLNTQTVLAEIDFSMGDDDATILGSVWNGELTMDEFTGVEGSPVRGHVEGLLYKGGPF